MPPLRVRQPLEVPIFGPDTGALAVNLGASRLELNRAGSYALGGTTPTISDLSTLLSSLSSSPPPQAETGPQTTSRPAIRIMIRPRGPPNNIISEGTTSNEQQQDFIYTPVELATMAASITTFAESGLLRPDQGDGFVFGVLRRTATPTPTPTAQSVSLELDVPRNKHLVDLARSYGFVSVLHRAVDDLFSCTLSSLDRTRTGDGEEDGGTSGAAGPQQQLVESVMERVRECGFDGMLTSGGKGAAGDNVDLVRRVVRAASTMGVEVIVGGGVRSAGLRGLVEGLGTGNLKGVWWHSSCLRAGDDGGKRFDEEEERRLVQEMRVLGLGL